MVNFLALQEAIYDLLKANAQLAPLISGVYDYVPDATAYPYVLVDALNASRDSRIDMSASLVVEQLIKCYTNDAEDLKGWAQLRAITSLVAAQFENAVFLVGQRRTQAIVSRVNLIREAGTVRSGTVSVSILFA